MNDPKKPPLRGLGRGLDALLPARMPAQPERAPAPGGGSTPSYGEGNVFSCPIDKIVPQRGQPRQHFDSDRLDELASSLREHGLLEPLVVRRRPGQDDFELIAGERRWRAAQRADLKQVLVVVRDVSAKDAFELALIENIQREDLDPIEFAEAMDRLVKEHGYTQDTLAQRVGKDRSTIANALRLLRLPATVREKVVVGELSEGHARALLGAPDDKQLSDLAEKVVRGRLSVRQTEALVRTAKDGKAGVGKSGAGKDSKPANVRDLEARLTKRLGTKVEVREKDGKGEIIVKYANWDELDRLLDVML
ncbi:MAG: Chromosome (plasmid) partitioning protein ParB [Polyangiaceae bacterium]|nr:Chromosome (plasmid) partitioning protein ParB [Polyangiaceae bacterium]